MADKPYNILFVCTGNSARCIGGVPDPAAFEGSDADRRARFRSTAVTLKRRIELMLALPLDRLDALAIGHGIKDIGTR